MNTLDTFKNIVQDVEHGDKTFYDHCYGVYKILKTMNCSQEVCNAGLFHSIYGTESFNTNIEISKQQVIDIIGDKSEKLVTMFCNLKNRYDSLLSNTYNLDNNTLLNLLYIEYANLKEQELRINDNNLKAMCENINNKIHELTNSSARYFVAEKEIRVYDNLIDNNTIEWLNGFCLASNYTPDHKSNNLNTLLDSRFVCNLNEYDFKNAKLDIICNNLSRDFNEKIHVGNAYINHYPLMASVSQHCDTSNEGTITVLIFCNKFWDKQWGGEIVFYNDHGNDHTMFDYVPGRIIAFDGRISHKVLPLNRNAQADRYTMAIKACTDKGLEIFKNVYQPFFVADKDKNELF